LRELGDNGLHVLAVAIKTLPRDTTRIGAGDESGLVLVGFLTFADPPKAGAAAAVAALRAALAVPLTALGSWFGMQAPPPAYFAILGALVVGYLALAEVAKRVFYARFAQRAR